jgi:hypothetical protein
LACGGKFILATTSCASTRPTAARTGTFSAWTTGAKPRLDLLERLGDRQQRAVMSKTIVA